MYRTTAKVCFSKRGGAVCGQTVRAPESRTRVQLRKPENNEKITQRKRSPCNERKMGAAAIADSGYGLDDKHDGGKQKNTPHLHISYLRERSMVFLTRSPCQAKKETSEGDCGSLKDTLLSYRVRQEESGGARVKVLVREGAIKEKTAAKDKMALNLLWSGRVSASP